VSDSHLNHVHFEADLSLTTTSRPPQAAPQPLTLI